MFVRNVVKMKKNKEHHFRLECEISHCMSLLLSELRWKLLSCQSAEAPETPVTSTTTKRKTSTSRKRRSAPKSLPIFSAGLPPGLTRVGKRAVPWEGRGGTEAPYFQNKMPHPFIPHTSRHDCAFRTNL